MLVYKYLNLGSSPLSIIGLFWCDSLQMKIRVSPLRQKDFNSTCTFSGTLNDVTFKTQSSRSHPGFSDGKIVRETIMTTTIWCLVKLITQSFVR